jgi:hypothetical protein
MTKFNRLFIVVICATLVLLWSPAAFAVEKVLETKAESITEAIDKNGNAYIRIIVEENKTLQGNTYSIGIPVMCFRETVDKARLLNPGDSFKAIVQPREFQGRSSYTLLKWLD